MPDTFDIYSAYRQCSSKDGPIQGRTGTKFSTGHKPPTGAPIRIEIKSAESKVDIFERSEAKRPSEAREQAAGGLEDAVSPPMGQGRSPGKF